MKFKAVTILTLVILALLTLFSFYYEIEGYWYIILILAWFALISVGSFLIGLNFHLKAFSFKPKSTLKKVAITFDDGPHPKHTLKVLEVLKKHGAKATFFCIGEKIEKYPHILKSISIEGHSIGNHSYSHSNFIDFNLTTKWIYEIEKTDELIQATIGMTPKLFRPPYGVTTPHLAKALKLTGHLVVGWNRRTLDTIIKNRNAILNRLKKKLKPGDIILLHDTQEQSLHILEHLLLYLKQQNFEAVTIEELYNEH